MKLIVTSRNFAKAPKKCIKNFFTFWKAATWKTRKEMDSVRVGGGCNCCATYKLPAKPAALFSIIVGSGGLHIMMSSWSDIMTTPGNCGNQMRTCTNPCGRISQLTPHHTYAESANWPVKNRHNSITLTRNIIEYQVVSDATSSEEVMQHQIGCADLCFSQQRRFVF